MSRNCPALGRHERCIGHPSVAGQTIFAGRYRLDGRAGLGGASMVYRAWDGARGRPVALKVLFSSDSASAERFWREAEITLSLDHPNVVRALDAGQAEGGRRFIAYELLDGETLKARLARLGPDCWQTVSRFAEQILLALCAAHDLGIIHRDIKPSNVFICSDGSLKLLDFGICRMQGTCTLTATGDVLGTPRYMSPEQLSPGPLTPASDLFSLGLLLAELLTGKPVYGGTPGETLIARVLPEPTPLSSEVLASPLGAIIYRATEKHVERRYASAYEMLLDLRSALEEAPSSGVFSKPDTVRTPPSFDSDETVRISA